MSDMTTATDLMAKNGFYLRVLEEGHVQTGDKPRRAGLEKMLERAV
jgi:MOSC domain-containing protein YiiM